MNRWSVAALLLAAPALPVTPAFGQSAAAPVITSQPVYEQPLTPRDVRATQDRLRALNFYQGGVDGVWGPGTAVAIQRFQASRGLQVTGDLNPVTVAALGMDLNSPLAEAASTVQPPSSPAEPLAPAVVQTIQDRLRRLGFYRGDIDGLWGASSQTAIERFQESRGLQADGQPNPATLAALGLNPNNLAAATNPANGR